MKKISFIVPLLAAVVLGGCSIPFLSKATEQVKQTAEEKVAKQEILSNCKYDKAICEYMAAQISVFKSGITLTSTMIRNGQPDGTETITMMDGNDNMQSITTKDGKETANVIRLNKNTYMKDYEDNTWFKMPGTDEKDDGVSQMDTTSTIEEMKKEFESDQMHMIYTKVRQEACGSMAPGLTCEIYEMYEQGNEMGKTKMWIDTKEHLTRKMEMPLANDSLSTLIYTYGPVTITEPTPVKEFSMPAIDYGSGQMPSQADLEKMMQDLPSGE